MLSSGWPDSVSRLLRVSADVAECYAVRQAALQFMSAAMGVDVTAVSAAAVSQSQVRV